MTCARRLVDAASGLLALASLAGLAGLATSPVAAAQDCDALFADALATRDVGAVAALVEGGAARAACAPNQLHFVRERATGWLAGEADVLVTAGNPDDAEALIMGAGGTRLRLTDLWRVNAVLGDVAMARERWSDAAVQYGEAYRRATEDFEAGGAVPGVAEKALQLELFGRSNEALMLAGDASMVARGDDGLLGSRGPKPRAVPVPIQFEFGSAEFAAAGRQAAARLADFLLDDGRDAIELVGHTDPVGMRERNRPLSERRAEAVAAAVRDAFASAGRPAPRIDVRGEGESCPPNVSDPARFTLDQLDSLYRRVELVLDPDAPRTGPRCGPPTPGRLEHER